jgi:hypothetical protein
MRRDYFELEVRNVEWVDADGDPEKPTLRIDFHGPEELLLDRLEDRHDRLEAAETDVSFRLLEDGEGTDREGVVAVTDRLTGDYVLEANEPAETVFEFVRAATAFGKSADHEGGYRIEVLVDGEVAVAFDKRTLLVYDAAGDLMRGESLIPSGVEL